MTNGKLKVLQIAGENGTIHATTAAAFAHRMVLCGIIQDANKESVNFFPMRYVVVKAGERNVLIQNNKGFKVKANKTHQAVATDFEARTITTPTPMILAMANDVPYLCFGDCVLELHGHMWPESTQPIDGETVEFSSTVDLLTDECDVDNTDLFRLISRNLSVDWSIVPDYVTEAELDAGQPSTHEQLAEILDGQPAAAQDAELLGGATIEPDVIVEQTRAHFQVGVVTLLDVQSSMFCHLAENWDSLPRCSHRTANSTVYMVLIDRGILAFHLPAQVSPNFRCAMDVVRALLLAKERYREVTSEELVDFNPALLFTSEATTRNPSSREHTRKDW